MLTLESCVFFVQMDSAILPKNPLSAFLSRGNRAEHDRANMIANRIRLQA